MNKKPIFGGAFTLFEFVRSFDNAGSSLRQGEQDVNGSKKIVIFTVSSAVKIRRECSELRAALGRYASVSSTYPILYYTHITLSRKNCARQIDAQRYFGKRLLLSWFIRQVYVASLISYNQAK